MSGYASKLDAIGVISRTLDNSYYGGHKAYYVSRIVADLVTGDSYGWHIDYSENAFIQSANRHRRAIK